MREPESPREIPIHQSANRPNQLLGGERESVIVAGMVAVLMIFSLGNWVGAVTGMLFWFAAIAALQRMGKADPLLRSVYFRHIRYRAFYPAKSGLLSRAVPPQAGQWR